MTKKCPVCGKEHKKRGPYCSTECYDKKRAKKVKVCPTCGTEHTKRGLFCSISCGNVREHDKESNRKAADTMRAYYAENKGEENLELHLWKAKRNALISRTSRLDPQAGAEIINDPDEYYFVVRETLGEKIGDDIWFNAGEESW